MTPPADAWEDGDALLSELLDDAVDETDALLLELLGEEVMPVAQWTELQPLRSPIMNRQTTTTLPARRVNKRTASGVLIITSLREEVNHLTSELHRLRSESGTCLQPFARPAKETAIDERLKRRRVEDECRQLREAVYSQTKFIRGLKSVLAMPLPLSPLDLAHYLHNYTRLPRERSTRWSEYAALAQETRFQSAMDLLTSEVQKIRVSDDADADEGQEVVPSLDDPFIHSELLKHHDGFSMTSTHVYALATDDLSAALRGLCVAVREIPALDPTYECVRHKKQLVDADAVLPSTSNGSNILYQVSGVDHKHPGDGDELNVESYNVALFKQTPDHALLLEDFVDDDELHPHNEATNITRQVVGACLIRRELCRDGQEHTVVRALRTRRFRFHEHTSPAILQRFQHLITTTTKANELIFRQLIHDSISHEERAFAQALGQLNPA